MRRRTIVFLFPALLLVSGGCGSSEGRASSAWSGTIDTLPSGQIVVSNPTTPVWRAGDEWRVVEEIRIGTLEGDGPDMFGDITSLEVDPEGRIWILEGQAQEIRVFGPDGRHVRTVGRQGGGPGEFARALQIRRGPDGNMWVIDPQNNRISVLDSAGTYLEGKQTPGGYIIIPWPGGFDAAGNYYSPVPLPSDGAFSMGLMRLDSSFTPIDTVAIPRDPVERERFEIRREDMRWLRSIPFTGGFDWRLAPSGTLWGMLTGEYRLFQLSLTGDTLRTITREFTPLPVTDADMDRARENLESFIRNGGKVDWSKIPSTKPATEDFFFDDEGNLWVAPVTTQEDDGQLFDVFDPDGRFLGTLRTPFPLATYPVPIIRNATIYGITEDELEVPYVVRARIEKGGR